MSKPVLTVEKWVIIFFVGTFVMGFGLNCQPKPKEKLKPAFSSISRLIFVKKYALHTCHSPSFYHESGNLDLSDEKAYSRIVNVKSHLYPDKFIIKPYDPDNSILINRLEETVWAGVLLERSSLNDNERQIVREWVKNGAKYD